MMVVPPSWLFITQRASSALPGFTFQLGARICFGNVEIGIGTVGDGRTFRFDAVPLLPLMAVASINDDEIGGMGRNKEVV